MEHQLLCFGDSNTWGFDPATGSRLPYAQRWTSVMASRLGPGWHVIAEGMNGRTTVFEDPIEPGRKGLDYLIPCLVTHQPLDVVLIMLGTNDTKYRFSLQASDIAQGMRRLVRTVLATDCGIAGRPECIGIIAPVPINEWVLEGPFFQAHQTSKKLGAEYRQVAKEFGCAFFDAGEHLYCGMPDGIHLNPAQHENLGQLLADWVTDSFGSV